jgi:hypothetical protein
VIQPRIRWQLPVRARSAASGGRTEEVFWINNVLAYSSTSLNQCSAMAPESTKMALNIPCFGCPITNRVVELHSSSYARNEHAIP